MNEREALKLALDALENHTAIKHPQQIHYRDKAITAAIKALAQPEQEPVACVGTNGELMWLNKSKVIYSKPIPLYTTPPTAPVQEPPPGTISTTITTTPQPKREWVGLTDEEIDELEDDRSLETTHDFICAIEAKLKEKNT